MTEYDFATIHIPVTVRHHDRVLTSHLLVRSDGRPYGLWGLPAGAFGQEREGAPIEQGPVAYAFAATPVLMTGLFAHEIYEMDHVVFDGVIYSVLFTNADGTLTEPRDVLRLRPVVADVEGTTPARPRPQATGKG